MVAVFLTGGIQDSLNSSGPNAASLERLWWLMFWVCAVVYVLVMIALFVAIRKGRRQSDLNPVLNPSPETETRKRNAVLSAVSATVVILFVFLIYSFSTGRTLTADLSQKSGLSIDVTAYQWWWDVRYNDVDASNIFTTANEIHIPVGVPVTFNLRANDVIHSFWVPNLAGKKDLIPGKISTIWLQADKPGVYRGQCAEYCGLQHARMALWIVAEPQEQFNAWRQNQTQGAVPPATDSQRHGQQVFLSSTCVMCHAVNGTTAGSNIGPNLTHVGSRNTIAAATLANTREHLLRWVADSQQFKPGNKMPANNLSEQDLNVVVDYLQSLK
ncbi:MAG TPA: cytochrome c oxidase subunit II [Pyrinomonadaceae bacterium]|jgi:cytochrome c oxidase subunit 2|nr:cytochrome c oxidase subunit II [Pyrinomonadaceae bacterium]